jgi:hypothetical protein
MHSARRTVAQFLYPPLVGSEVSRSCAQAPLSSEAVELLQLDVEGRL